MSCVGDGSPVLRDTGLCRGEARASKVPGRCASCSFLQSLHPRSRLLRCKERATEATESLTSVSSDFARESWDQVWADRMTKEIQSSVGGVLATGTAINAVEYQSTFCRVTVSHANEAARQTLLTSIPRTRSGLPPERGCSHWTRTSPRRQCRSCREKSGPAPKRAESVAAAVVLCR